MGSMQTGASGSESAPLFLGEVATIKFENARPDNIVRINGSVVLVCRFIKRHNSIR